MKLNDFIAEAETRFGKNPLDWKFVCPSCKTVQSGSDLVARGVPEERVQSIIGFSCIGRYDPLSGCDWSLGGLFRIHELEIEYDDGSPNRPCFELAEVPQ
jgi:hypothetical protein